MMIVAWKYRTNFENAYDSFGKISKFHKDAGADWINMFITTGADNGSFITAVGFENMKAYGKMDDMWNAPDSEMDKIMANNLSDTHLIETYNLNLMAGNIEGDQSPEVFSNFIFECDDVQAVRDSHEADWKYYQDGGCTGIDIHRISGGDYASNNTFMFCARFKSMEDLGANWDRMGESSYGKDLSDYHSKIKIIKNFNGRSLKFERFKS
jgi:hypothetical protein